jgi:glycosyltransferase involved in cell wall biosynthesis
MGTAVIRLGIDVRELQAGLRTGIGRYVMEVLRAASRAGWECVAYGDRGTGLDTPPPGVRLQVLENPWTQWWDQVTLPRALGRDRIAVFLSPYYKGPLLAPCPVVLTIHDLYFIGYPWQPRPWYDAVVHRMARLYTRRAAAIIADSEYSKRSIVERLSVDPAKITVVPVALGPEFQPHPLTDAVKNRYGIAGPYIFYVGNFKPHKNLPRLIRAYAALPELLRSRHCLILAGSDPERRPDLEALARSLGVADRILFPGRIEDQDLPALYSGSTVCVLPSLEEGFGLPALEAMACGAPVIAANRAAIPEVAGNAAVLFDPLDVAAIAAAMARVLSASEMQEDLRRLGLARAGEFTPERTSGQVLALLHKVSGAGGSSAANP